MQQTYSSSLCTHVNNIYSKLSELQRQIQNQGDTVRIEAPDFNPDIDGVSSPSTEEKPNELMTQGILSPTPEVTKPEDDSLTPATTISQITSQEKDWPDAIPVQIPWVSSSSSHLEEQEIIRSQTRYNSQSLEILELRTNLKKSSLPIWTRTWHTTTHMKLGNIYIKNTDPACMP